jgi:hypothetical protein
MFLFMDIVQAESICPGYKFEYFVAEISRNITREIRGYSGVTGGTVV